MKGFGGCNSRPKSADLKIQTLSGWAKSNHMSPSQAASFLRLIVKEKVQDSKCRKDSIHRWWLENGGGQVVRNAGLSLDASVG